MTLSIIIPAYNEEKTISHILTKLLTVRLPDAVDRELIVVNDCSIDHTEEVVQAFMQANPLAPIRYAAHGVNQGKGAALQTGIQLATGDLLIVQDADLEYNPDEFGMLLRPILDDVADVVYGSRFIGGNAHRILFFWHTIGNKFLTLLSNMVNNLNLSDMETGYKLFRTEVIKGIVLNEKRFGFEPEITAKVARIPSIRIYEVGISYYGRTYEEGKKINWRDGFRAIYCIIRYGLFA